METTNNAAPITSSTQDPQPGQPIGTEGKWVVVPECKPVLMGEDHEPKWAEMGAEIRTHNADGDVEAVLIKDVGKRSMPYIHVNDAPTFAEYLGWARMLVCYNGNGSKVKQQSVARAYGAWLVQNKVDAWEKDGDKLLKPTYVRIYLQKVWASLAGIELEPRKFGPRVVEVEVRVVTLPDGSTFKVDKSDEAEPVMQLFSAYVDALTREPLEMDIDDAMEKAKKMLDSGKLAQMLEAKKEEAKKE